MVERSNVNDRDLRYEMACALQHLPWSESKGSNGCHDYLSAEDIHVSGSAVSNYHVGALGANDT